MNENTKNITEYFKDINGLNVEINSVDIQCYRASVDNYCAVYFKNGNKVILDATFSEVDKIFEF